MSDVDLDVRVRFLETLEAFRSSDDAHKLDYLAAMLLDEIHGLDSGAAGRQHRIGDHDRALTNRARELAVILVRLMRRRVAVQANVSDLGGGNKLLYAADHAKSGPEDRNDGQLLAADHGRHAFLNGSFDFDIFHG